MSRSDSSEFWPEPKEEDLWFNRKRYGWGWGFPTVWQGWAVLLVVIVSIVIPSMLLFKDIPEDPPFSQIIWPTIIVFLVSSTVPMIMMIILRKHIPKPRWQWGKQK